ncbi:MAG: hypothetical protein GXO39_03180 [Thermotogae bacterium]|nr:hypothetical protein [Thermotogota bacterium]
MGLLFFGLFLISIFLYAVYPERIKLWTLLGLSSFSAGLMGAFKYPDPYVWASFGVTMLGGILGWILFNLRDRRKKHDRGSEGQKT